ncbi:MAG: MAPEG family protein [Aquabacterium sp.]
MTLAPGQSAILYPVAALALLTVVVMGLMLRERIAEMKERRIHPQKMPSSSQMAAVLQNTRGADNYKNLFEMPVLFYVLALALLATGSVTPLQLGLAWGYVALRVVHSFIHVGYNKVMHRFQVFALSGLVLGVMWVLFVVRLAGTP